MQEIKRIRDAISAAHPELGDRLSREAVEPVWTAKL
jgi:hypothetical protein